MSLDPFVRILDIADSEETFSDLIGHCPSTFFMASNEWFTFAYMLRKFGGNTANWMWKSNLTQGQKEHFLGILRYAHKNGPTIGQIAITGWMLSLVLEQVPQWQPKSDF